jgi:HEPN domain-containing protein
MKQATRADAERWITEAEKDIKDAELLLRHEGYYPLCRLACLATAKAMRGLLVGLRQPFSEQADLATLGRQVSSVEPSLAELIEALGAIQQFAPPEPAADPEAAPSPAALYSREAAKRSLALARETVILVKRQLTALP